VNPNNKNPAAGGGRAPNSFCLAAVRSEDSQLAHRAQGSVIASDPGVTGAPALASLNEGRSRSQRSLKRSICRGKRIDFDAINKAALPALPAVLARLLPGGKRVGAEIVALNPRRADRHLGSFRINAHSGRWADFATGDKGGDLISLVAYLAGVSQGEAARLLAQMLGMEAGGPRDG
jgi:hypothetical protein